MADYDLTTIRPESLDDFLSFDRPLPISEALARNLQNGKLTFDQMYLFRHRGKPEAAFTLTASPVVVPHMDAGMAKVGRRAFATLVRELLEGTGKIVIVDSVSAPVGVDAFIEAGWTVTSHDKLYRTDLMRGSWDLDAVAEELGAGALLSPELRAFYNEILKTDTQIGDTGTDNPDESFGEAVFDDTVRLFVIRREGRVLAAATLFSVAKDEAGVHLLGVVPAQRNKGIGRRLHAHVLAVAKSGARFHVGGTRADNTAMHRIYMKNGAVLVSEQVQLMLAGELED